MEITRENVNALNATVKIKLKPEDYQQKVDEVIKKQQKNARVPGFRPGKVPSSLIKKMYGKSVLVDEVNKILSGKIYEYLKENNIEILGNPLPKMEDADKINWDNPSDMEFMYDLGLTPQFDLNISSSNSIDYFVALVDENMIDKEVKSLSKRHGNYTSPEQSDDKCMMHAEFIELDSERKPLEGGIVHTSLFNIDLIKDAEIKNSFIGVKKEETVIANLNKAYENTVEIANLLGIAKETAENLNSDFMVRITNITKVEDADLNEELYDKIYGPGIVKDEQSFRDKIKEGISHFLEADSDRKLLTDLRTKILGELNLALPDEFLKRWLMHVSETPLTVEQVETDYNSYKEALQWKLVENKIIIKNELKLSVEEVKDFAKNSIRQQFMQYGYYEFPEDKLEEYTNQYLQKEEEVRRIQETLLSSKVFNIIKHSITLNKKELSYDDFVKLLNPNNT